MDLLKKGDSGKFPDDDWREILVANGFTPFGATEEVWRRADSDFKVRISVDRETEEPYYQVVTVDGARSAKWNDPEVLKNIVEPKEPEPPKLSPEEEMQSDKKFLQSMGIVGRQRTSKKFAGRPPRFSFTVPTQAAGPVAFHLAKAGMKDFDVEHYEEDDFSVFTFPSEPEMHVAEEIVKAEYADQIKAHKGLWGMWAEDGRGQPATVTAASENMWLLVISNENGEVRRFSYATQEDAIRNLKAMAKHFFPSNQEEDLLNGRGVNIGNYLVRLYNEDYSQQPRLDVYASVEQPAAWAARSQGKFAGQWGDRSYDSDHVHDILDKHRQIPTSGNTKGFDEPVPDESLPALLEEIEASSGSDDGQYYLGIIVFLVTHGSDVPKLYRDRARQIAFTLVSDENYLSEWQNPGLRRVELENEIELLEGPGKTASNRKTAANRENVMAAYRRKKLLAWIEELGLDLSEELTRYDSGDFWEKDVVYEEVRDMIREDRRDQRAYRRTMLGR